MATVTKGDDLEPSSPPALAAWWRQNRSWALPTSCLAVLLPLIALGSCAGTFLTFAFGTVRLGASLRKSGMLTRRKPDRSS